MDSLQSKISVNTMTAYFGIFKGKCRFIQIINLENNKKEIHCDINETIFFSQVAV
jgi:hypothetical protein